MSRSTAAREESSAGPKPLCKPRSCASAGFHVAFLAEAAACLAAAGLVLLVPASLIGSLLRPQDVSALGEEGRRRVGGTLLTTVRHLRDAYSAGSAARPLLSPAMSFCWV